MNLMLNYKGFESNLVKREPLYEGIHYIFRFENNYGASVVKHNGSYGHSNDYWELAVIQFTDENNDSWELNYDTDITCDVLGWLDDEDVQNTLRRIKEL